LAIVHPHAAGIDVGNSAHDVAVRPDRDPDSVRRFEGFTADLHRLADWLQQCGVTTVAMQSTGVYWMPLYEILDARGLEVYLVNARHTKNLLGRKSDVQESQWLLKLHTYGLLRKSFHPPADIRALLRDNLHLPARVVVTRSVRLRPADAPYRPRGVEPREGTINDHPRDDQDPAAAAV
jgi:transposase